MHLIQQLMVPKFKCSFFSLMIWMSLLNQQRANSLIRVVGFVCTGD